MSAPIQKSHGNLISNHQESQREGQTPSDKAKSFLTSFFALDYLNKILSKEGERDIKTADGLNESLFLSQSSQNADPDASASVRIVKVAAQALPQQAELQEHHAVLDFSMTGSFWLKEAFLKAPIASSLKQEEISCFAFLLKECIRRNEWDLSKLFPERSVSQDTVQKLTLRQLKDLPPEVFLAISDLLSGKQTMAVFNSELPHSQKLALCYFNKEYGIAFASYQKIYLNAFLQIDVSKAAQEALSRYKKYSKKDIEAFMATPAFKKIEEGQFVLPATSPKNQDQVETIERWKKLNSEYLPQGLKTPITPEFLIEINTAFRGKGDTSMQGFREDGVEIFDPHTAVHSLPGSAVQSEMKQLIESINAQLNRCDSSSENPIIAASATCQKLLSFRPFIKENERTGRFIADLILRRYGILPVTWKEEHCHVGVQLAAKEKVDSNKALEWMLEGLERSYALSESDAKLAAQKEPVPGSSSPTAELTKTDSPASGGGVGAGVETPIKPKTRLVKKPHKPSPATSPAEGSEERELSEADSKLAAQNEPVAAPESSSPTAEPKPDSPSSSNNGIGATPETPAKPRKTILVKKPPKSSPTPTSVPAAEEIMTERL